MALELKNAGFLVEQQKSIQVFYKGNIVGDYRADLFVNGEIIVELKSVTKLIPEHEVQLVNYLNGSKKDFGLLINFGISVEVKRKYRAFRKKNPDNPVNLVSPILLV